MNIKVFQVNPYTVQVVNGRWKENCYLISHNQRDCVVIDPGSCEEELQQIIDGRGLKPEAILCTHAHYDHVGAARGLSLAYQAPIYLHPDDLELLEQLNTYKVLFSDGDFEEIPKVSYLLSDQQKLDIAGFEIDVLHLPGHTRGSCAFLIGDDLFIGDTLVESEHEAHPATGFEPEKLKKSLERIRGLKFDGLVLPGHGRPFESLGL